MKKYFKTSLYLLVAILVGVSSVYATSKLTPPETVTNTMYSLTDIWNLHEGITGTEGTGVIETTPTSIEETRKTLTEIYTDISTEIAKLSTLNIASGTTAFGIVGAGIISLGDAVNTNVLEGKYFSNVTTANILGTMPNNGAITITPNTGNQTIALGYHNGSGVVEGDTDLIASNIKSGANIFGVGGSLITTPTYGDNNASKVLNTASNPGTYDVNTCSTTYNTLNLGAGTVKSGTAYGNGAMGDYPSVTYPISGDTGTTDATNTSVLSGFEAWTKSGSLLTGSAILALGDAINTNVLAGKYFSNVTTSNVLGTMPDKTGLNVASTAQSQAGGVNYFTVAQGYYDGTAKVSGTDSEVAVLDADIAEGNIKSGTTIFGVLGNMSAGTNYALPKTGQTTVYTTNDDGTYKKGFAGTRFTDNGNGTITDNATGLMWIKDHNAVGAPFNATMSWTNAITNCEALTYPAGSYTDWRLPNVKELQSIVDYGRYNQAINPLFTNTQSLWYRSSTTYIDSTTSTWAVSFSHGGVDTYNKDSSIYVRCVRG